MTAPTLTLRAAADAAGVSLKTMRRRATSGAFPNATRLDGPGGPGTGAWEVPATDLIAAGFDLTAPTATPEPEPGEVERLRAELDAEHVRRVAAEREALDLRANLDDVRLALRALSAAVDDRPEPEPEPAPPEPEPVPEPAPSLLGRLRRNVFG